GVLRLLHRHPLRRLDHDGAELGGLDRRSELGPGLLVLRAVPIDIEELPAHLDGHKAVAVLGPQAHRADIGDRVEAADVVDRGQIRSTESPRPPRTGPTTPDGKRPWSTTPGITARRAASSPGSCTLPWKSAITPSSGLRGVSGRSSTSPSSAEIRARVEARPKRD